MTRILRMGSDEDDEEVRSVASSHTYKQVGRVSWLGEQDMK